MKIMTAYGVGIKHYNHILKDSVRIYRDAVDFLIDVCLKEWDSISIINGLQSRCIYVESLVHRTKKRPVVPYDFDHEFYKFPSYLLRSAICCALGKASSYLSNLENWKNADAKCKGQQPGYPKAGFVFPCLYKGNMYLQTGDYEFQIKVYIRNTWDWIPVQVRKSDMDYIRHHCTERKRCSPELTKRGKKWALVFPFEEKVDLHNTPNKKQTIVAVDLGINNACVCSVMQSDGTVLGRKFLKLPREYDCLMHKLSHIKRAQHHGSKKTRNLWAYANGVNDDIASKTASFIVKVAVEYQADTIVFEHLGMQGKKRGGAKQRLHLWKARTVQKIVENKAHRLGMRIARICAWNTSRLAYDGSGRVRRGRESDKTMNHYSLCEFTTGKLYHCDLNASYNIGARYFIRELLKPVSATRRQHILANVPECAKRSTCTLSTLISLNAELYASA